MQYISFYSPKNKRIHLKAVIYYVGGAKTTGAGAFAGIEATYKYRNLYRKKDIVQWINIEIVADKIIDLASMAAPEVKVKSVAQALEVLGDIHDYYNLATSIIDLVNAGKGKKFVYSFNIKAHKGYNTIGIGVRGNCSGIVTGSSFSILGGIIDRIVIQY